MTLEMERKDANVWSGNMEIYLKIFTRVTFDSIVASDIGIKHLFHKHLSCCIMDFSFFLIYWNCCLLLISLFDVCKSSLRKIVLTCSFLSPFSH